MRANTPRSWQSLPAAQRQKIEEHARSVAREIVERDMRAMLDQYIKMVCMTLHDAFGFGERRLTYFLGCHKRLFYRQRRMVRDGTQLGYLNARMAEIFKRDGFPQGFFDGMLGPVEEHDGAGGASPSPTGKISYVKEENDDGKRTED